MSEIYWINALAFWLFNEPVTGGDIAQLSRQTFYALDEFRKEIIKYLESNR